MTHILANKFTQEGHHCYVFSLHPNTGQTITPSLSEGIELTCINTQNFTEKEMRNFLRKKLQEWHIDIIINQSGQLLRNTRLAKQASHGLAIKIISVLHNTPDFIINHHATSLYQKALNLKRRYYLRCCYSLSDAFVLLSSSFIPIFKRLTQIKRASKLTAITNPFTLSVATAKDSHTEKEKMLLYVGRLERKQKRIERILAVWQTLQSHYADWQLCIVGDGPDRQRLENIVYSQQLKNVTFAGFQPPEPFYRQASILLQSSDYEGFGLVIPEAMSMGVVPIVYGSYTSIYDIIQDGINGFISAPKAGIFDLEDFTAKVKLLMDSETQRKEMSQSAILTSSQFTPDNIYQLWEAILKKD